METEEGDTGLSPAQLATLRRTLSEALDQLTKNERDIRNLRVRNKHLANSHAALKAEAATARREVLGYEENIRHLTILVNASHEQINALKSQLDTRTKTMAETAAQSFVFTLEIDTAADQGDTTFTLQPHGPSRANGTVRLIKNSSLHPAITWPVETDRDQHMTERHESDPADICGTATPSHGNNTGTGASGIAPGIAASTPLMVPRVSAYHEQENMPPGTRKRWSSNSPTKARRRY